jgi:hydrogenase-4 membrane subunit HyfE
MFFQQIIVIYVNSFLSSCIQEVILLGFFDDVLQMIVIYVTSSLVSSIYRTAGSIDSNHGEEEFVWPLRSEKVLGPFDSTKPE